MIPARVIYGIGSIGGQLPWKRPTAMAYEANIMAVGWRFPAGGRKIALQKRLELSPVTWKY